MADETLVNIPTFFHPSFDKYMGMPTVFTFIVLFQGCFGGLGIAQTPKALDDLLNTKTHSPIWRFLFVCAIGYTATSDLETACIVTVAFFAFLHIIRSPEERKEVPYFV